MTPCSTTPEDDSYDLPCAEAMLAGTLALMTGHAESACSQQRTLMARKVVSNLFFLASHPGLNPNFRAVVGKMHQHWTALAKATDGPLASVRSWQPDLGSVEASTSFH